MSHNNLDEISRKDNPQILIKDLDFRISREVYKISPIDYKHYKQEQTYEISYIGRNEHIKSGIHPLGVFPKEVALELSIRDERNRQLTNLIRDDNSKYSIQALNGKLRIVLTLIEAFMSKPENQRIDKNTPIDLNKRLLSFSMAEDTMKRFHNYFVFSLPKNSLKWEMEEKLRDFGLKWLNKDMDWQNLNIETKKEELSPFFKYSDKEFIDSLEEKIKSLSTNTAECLNEDQTTEELMKTLDFFKEYFLGIIRVQGIFRHDKLTFSLTNPVFNPILLVREIKKYSKLIYNSNYKWFDILHNLHHYIGGFLAIVSFYSALKHLESDSLEIKKILSSINQYIYDLNLLYHNYSFLVEREVIKDTPYIIKINMLIPTNFPEEINVKKQIAKTVQTYPLIIGNGDSTHIEISSPDSSISIENRDSNVTNKNTNAVHPEDYFDYCYQLSEKFDGKYDLHHYCNTNVRIFDNKRTELNDKINIEIELTETFRLKGIIISFYSGIISVFLLAFLVFSAIGINILYLKINQYPYNSWISVSTNLGFLVSFSGLSLSVIAITASFRQDHLIILHHTDKARTFIIYCVLCNILLLLFNHTFILSDFFWNSLPVLDSNCAIFCYLISEIVILFILSKIFHLSLPECLKTLISFIMTYFCN